MSLAARKLRLGSLYYQGFRSRADSGAWCHRLRVRRQPYRRGRSQISFLGCPVWFGGRSRRHGDAARRHRRRARGSPWPSIVDTVEVLARTGLHTIAVYAAFVAVSRLGLQRFGALATTSRTRHRVRARACGHPQRRLSASMPSPTSPGSRAARPDKPHCAVSRETRPRHGHARRILRPRARRSAVSRRLRIHGPRSGR